MGITSKDGSDGSKGSEDKEEGMDRFLIFHYIAANHIPILNIVVSDVPVLTTSCDLVMERIYL